jgi:hypothetical protein
VTPVGPIFYLLLALLGWGVAVDAMRRVARRMEGRPAVAVVTVMAVTGLLLLMGGWVFYSMYLLVGLVRQAPRHPVEVA